MKHRKRYIRRVQSQKRELEQLQYGEEVLGRLRSVRKLSYLGRRGQLLELMWVPGHMGVGRNETADKAAKEAASGVETVEDKRTEE